jgi:hypothetical protein
MVAVDPDGTLRVLHRENLDDPEGTWKSAGEAEVEPGAAFPVVVTRAAGEGASFELSVNGTRVGDPVEVKPWRGGKRQQVSAVFFVAAEPGKKVEAELNRARIVEFVES